MALAPAAVTMSLMSLPSGGLRKPLVFNPMRATAPQAATRARLVVRASSSSPGKEQVVAGLTAAALAAALLIPEVAEAAQPGLSPSLKNFLLSIVAGGVVLTAIIGAVIGVANFDPSRFNFPPISPVILSSCLLASPLNSRLHSLGERSRFQWLPHKPVVASPKCGDLWSLNSWVIHDFYRLFASVNALDQNVHRLSDEQELGFDHLRDDLSGHKEQLAMRRYILKHQNTGQHGFLRFLSRLLYDFLCGRAFL
ncbi:hypothetical protein J5N97_000159 [Dioscorea zingiberensis]|uniref:Uncharacterized protein n=1 Tax=Dioscorea zingiberensis TaxID=325984 RepID=A0A9D5BSJ1_9LILI|nr:hypothetical protein J5N97_000159 [Dioscorea zingiberensis]